MVRSTAFMAPSTPCNALSTARTALRIAVMAPDTLLEAPINPFKGNKYSLQDPGSSLQGFKYSPII
jgi:hypothetical protein